MSEAHSTVEYREIKGFPGYRVGNDGSVWSCRRKGTVGSSWRKLVPVPGKHGHRSVVLCPERVSMYVHRLVLEAFVGPCPPGMECCHFPDRNPANNKLSNLRWDTHKNNMADAISHGTNNDGEKSNFSKLSLENVLQIESCAKAGEDLPVLASKFLVSVRTIRRIIQVRTWKRRHQ